jgi:hypothetical protein
MKRSRAIKPESKTRQFVEREPFGPSCREPVWNAEGTNEVVDRVGLRIGKAWFAKQAKSPVG